jgi:cytochrome c-type biogenesis protein CcmF
MVLCRHGGPDHGSRRADRDDPALDGDGLALPDAGEPFAPGGRTRSWLGRYWPGSRGERLVLPWLPATAFLHSIQVQSAGGCSGLEPCLIILTFALTISDLPDPPDPPRSTFWRPVGVLFRFLALIVAGSFGLLVWRADRFRGQPELDSMVSRESSFLLNNVVLVSALFAIFLGTVFPLLSEAVAGVRWRGAPYQLMIPPPGLVFLMGRG